MRIRPGLKIMSDGLHTMMQNSKNLLICFAGRLRLQQDNGLLTAMNTSLQCWHGFCNLAQIDARAGILADNLQIV
jgi:hypothetical protein